MEGGRILDLTENRCNVSLSGDGKLLAVGSLNSENTGITRIYEHDDTGLIQIGENIIGKEGEYTNKCSLNKYSNVLIVGAPRFNPFITRFSGDDLDFKYNHKPDDNGYINLYFLKGYQNTETGEWIELVLINDSETVVVEENKLVIDLYEKFILTKLIFFLGRVNASRITNVLNKKLVGNSKI